MKIFLPAAMLALGLWSGTPSFAQMTSEKVLPSATNPRIRNFDFPNIIVNGDPSTRRAPLVVFMPGTDGGENGGPDLLMQTVAQQGYRVIFLAYNNSPSVSQVCPQRPPACSAHFREARIFGSQGPVSNSAAEAVVPRLVALLRYLDRIHPDAGWRDYLTRDGSPLWPRIVVSGLSQGAGMAAYLAKRFPVRRVVLFSSPWDAFGPQQQPAPWLNGPSITPPGLWWAERHARENTTQLIAHAYRALDIPPAHILIFNGGLPMNSGGRNPYHISTVRLPAYVPQWRAMFGSPEGTR